jgi:hypothetical protein
MRSKIQIDEIVTQAFFLFERMAETEGAKITVTLALMGTEHIDKVLTGYPPDRPMRSPIEKLRVATSGFSRAKACRSIIVVPDTTSEAAKGEAANFAVTREELRNEPCSLICYPVSDHGQEIPMVISISANRKDHFSEEAAAVYEDLLKPFGHRLALEFFLLQLKQRVTPPRKKG